MARVIPKAVIEVSSEAGRKIGGIYTVIRSKAPQLHGKFGDKYLLIGMLDAKCDEDIKFEEPQGEMRGIFDRLAREGIACKIGKWTYADNSRIISVDAKLAGERAVEYDNGQGVQRDRQINYFKYLLWKEFGVESYNEKSWDFTENVAWCFGVGRLLEELFKEGLFSPKSTAVQFHEWISGAALLYCKMKGLGAGTVFTTHATVLGRTLAASGVDVFSASLREKSQIGVSAAYENKVEGKHLLEMAAARESDVFTTVSETVAAEVAYILGRKADIVTVNGIEYSEGKEKEAHDLSGYARAELQQFLEGCFISYYQQRYDNALFFYTSGRYEFTNKGFDVFIEALGKLNARLEKEKSDRKVFAFIFAPSSVRGPKISIIKNYFLLDKIYEVLHELPELKGKPFSNLPLTISKLEGQIKYDLENMAKGFAKDGEKPHINCYDLTYTNDAIINACVKAGLDNSEKNAVKVIFYPTYMKPNDGLMNLNYYDVTSAMDAGVFPSRYEPFGYTPVEAAIKEDLAITSDMTGFGRFIKKKLTAGCGVSVIAMAGRSGNQASDALANELERIYRLSPNELEAEKVNAYRMMRHIDWGDLVKNYYKAYEMALSSAEKE
jgi:glycosyltransferase involved in cell wall biosynthesis